MGKTILNLNNTNMEQIKSFLEMNLSDSYKFKLAGREKNILIVRKESVETIIRKKDESYEINVSSNRLIMGIAMGITAGVVVRFGGAIGTFITVLIVGYIVSAISNLVNKEKIKSIESEILEILRRI